MANAAAIMASMQNAAATNACSTTWVPPIRTTMSRAASPPSSSPMPCTMLPISNPYRHNPTVHSTRAPRSNRHASPKALRSNRVAPAGPGRSAISPAPTSRPASSR